MPMKGNREAAPEIFIIIEAKIDLKKLNKLSPDVEKSLKEVYRRLVKRPRNCDTYPELVRAGVAAPNWAFSKNPYPREYVCLWCEEKWQIKNIQKNQWYCPNSCNLPTESE